VRRALSFHARSGAGPGLLERLRYAVRGTPQHRLGASAAVMLMHAVAAAASAPGLEPDTGWRAALAELGVVRDPGEAAAAERELVRCWDRWVLDGRRSAEAS
jgi:hypothetical protein